MSPRAVVVVDDLALDVFGGLPAEHNQRIAHGGRPVPTELHVAEQLLVPQEIRRLERELDVPVGRGFWSAHRVIVEVSTDTPSMRPRTRTDAGRRFLAEGADEADQRAETNTGPPGED